MCDLCCLFLGSVYKLQVQLWALLVALSHLEQLSKQHFRARCSATSTCRNRVLGKVCWLPQIPFLIWVRSLGLAEMSLSVSFTSVFLFTRAFQGEMLLNIFKFCFLFILGANYFPAGGAARSLAPLSSLHPIKQPRSLVLITLCILSSNWQHSIKAEPPWSLPSCLHTSEPIPRARQEMQWLLSVSRCPTSAFLVRCFLHMWGSRRFGEQ